MNGDILLNLDSEDEGELFIGCAGGAGTTAQFPCPMVKSPEGYFFFRVTVKGLTGGHSGDDINKKRANANKVLNRYLMQISQKYDLYLAEIDGGNLHNAIPREAHAVCAVPMKDKESVRVDLNIFLADVENEFSVTEPNIRMDLESETALPEVIEKTAMTRFLNSIHAVHNGVFAMSQDIPGLVQTSLNLGVVKLGERFTATSAVRSSVNAEKVELLEQLKSLADMFDGRGFYAAKSAGDGEKRYLFGWIPTKTNDRDQGGWEWGGSLAVHELYQRPDGTLGVRAPAQREAAFTEEAASDTLTVRGTSGRTEEIGAMPHTYLLRCTLEGDFARAGFAVAHSAAAGYRYVVDTQNNTFSFENYPSADLFGDVTVPITPAQAYEIVLFVEGNVCTAYINGEKALSARTEGALGGAAGFYVQGGEASVGYTLLQPAA